MSGGDGILGEMTATGWHPAGEISYEEWQRAGEFLDYMTGAVQWAIGDWLNYGERRYGETYTQALDFTNYDIKTLKNFKWVSGVYEKSLRRDLLSWTHHKEVAAFEPDVRNDILAKAESEGWSWARLRKEAREARRLKDNTERASTLPPEGARHKVFCASIESAEIEPGSIDAIVTDPPYPEEYLGLFDVLAERANEWLRDGGVLAVMSGQTYLPEVYKRLSGPLTYRWTFAYLTPGGQAVQIWPRCIQTFWKPVLVYVKGDPSSCEWAGDVTRSDVNDNDKVHHHWGQSASGMMDLLPRITRVGDLILDPFLGGGTTGIAALNLQRRFIGFDVDEECVERSAARLHEVSNAAAA